MESDGVVEVHAPSGPEVSETPNESADPEQLVREMIPQDIFDRFDIYSYRNAAVILSEARKEEFADIIEALRGFSLTTDMIRRAGGNESEIPKLFSEILRPRGWNETTIQGDLLVRLTWRKIVERPDGRRRSTKKEKQIVREKYLDGHKIDYVKGRLAFDLEWNSKDQTFDRDLYAFSAFSQCGVIDAAVLATRSASLNPVFRSLGESLNRDGKVETKPDGSPRMVFEKYGASTTWMGKLLYRLNAGRNGGCPVLAVGIGPNCIQDLEAG